jgi:hypothetical protein
MAVRFDSFLYQFKGESSAGRVPSLSRRPLCSNLSLTFAFFSLLSLCFLIVSHASSRSWINQGGCAM